MDNEIPRLAETKEKHGVTVTSVKGQSYLQVSALPGITRYQQASSIFLLAPKLQQLIAVTYLMCVCSSISESRELNVRFF